MANILPLFDWGMATCAEADTHCKAHAHESALYSTLLKLCEWRRAVMNSWALFAEKPPAIAQLDGEIKLILAALKRRERRVLLAERKRRRLTHLRNVMGERRAIAMTGWVCR